ncbi:MAG: HAD-IA family hydrolase [Candidatus Bathyarchaeia archaeon]
MRKAALLDFGDTLVLLKEAYIGKVEELRAKSLVEYLKKKGLTVEEGEFRERFIKVSKRMNDFCERYSVELTIDIVVAEALREMGFKVEPKDVWDVEEAAYGFLLEACMVSGEALPALERLKTAGFKMAVISNTRSDWFVREALRKLNILDFFDYVSTSANLGVRKPRPEPFLKALKELSLTRREAVMIGDQTLTDVKGALNLGMKVIQIIGETQPFNPRVTTLKPTFYAQNLNEAANKALTLF